jgi:hypothetical protein
MSYNHNTQFNPCSPSGLGMPVQMADPNKVKIRNLTNFKNDLVLKAIDLVATAALVLVSVALLPVTILFLAAYRIYNYSRVKGLVQELAVNQHKCLAEQIHAAFPDGIEYRTLHGEQGLIFACTKIVKLVENNHYSEAFSMPERMRMIRETINEALALPAYQNNKGAAGEPLIKFFQLCAHSLTARSDGMSAIQKYGKEQIGVFGNRGISYKDFADKLDEAVYDYSGFKRDSIVGTVFWSMAHPEKALFAASGQIKSNALSYNSFKEGNVNTKLGAYRVGNRRIHLSVGPVPTCDRLFDAHLDYLKYHLRSGHLQHTYESPHGAEGVRRQRLKHTEERRSGELMLMALPLDGAAYSAKGDFKGIDDTEQFHDHLNELVKGTTGQDHRAMQAEFHEDNGFYIPEDLIPQNDIDQAIVASKTAFASVETEPYWQALANEGDKGTVRLNKAQLLAFDGILAVKSLLGAMSVTRGTDKDLFMIAVCKQCIDRGVVMNVVTRLLIDGLNGEPLTGDRIHQIIGFVLARAAIIDNRRIILERFEPLSDLLHLIGDDPEGFFAPIRAYFAEDLQKMGGISFEPALDLVDDDLGEKEKTGDYLIGSDFDSGSETDFSDED